MNALTLASYSLAYGRDRISKVKERKNSPPREVQLGEAQKYPFIYGNVSRLGLVTIDVDDVDEEESYCSGLDESHYDNVNAPVPLYCINTSGSRFQVGYALRDSLPLPKKCSPASLAYFQAVKESLTVSLNGDFAVPMRGWIRNPLYKGARIRLFPVGLYELGDLHVDYKLDVKAVKRYARSYEKGNRNRATFMFALEQFKDSKDSLTFDVLLSRIKTFQALNSPVEPLSLGENRGIVASVLRNGPGYYRPGWKHDPKWNVGALALGDPGWSTMTRGQREAEIRLRQGLGALHCHEVRKVATMEKLRRTMDRMLGQGLPITVQGVARASGSGRNTVKRFWTELTGECR